jgi:TonB family protein
LELPSLSQPAVRGWTLAVSVLLHAVAVTVLAMMASEAIVPQSPGRGFRASAILVAPPVGFTQTEPNRAKIGKELSLDNLVPRRALRVPPAIPALSRKAAPAPVVPPLPEPPKGPATNVQTPPAPQLGSTQMPGPPPQIQTEEQPKLAFETPGMPSGLPRASRRELGLKSPGEVITEAQRASPRAAGSAVQVSDYDLPSIPGLGSGVQQAPSPGRPTTLELLSDPGGVDFKPYLIRILATVKRNWLAVIPETARLGRQGRVQVQFAIDRNGYVPKLVIAMPSGTESLDRAAVAGIGASQPFPPPPAEFQGTQVRLQFTFTYNMR